MGRAEVASLVRRASIWRLDRGVVSNQTTRGWMAMKSVLGRRLAHTVAAAMCLLVLTVPVAAQGSISEEQELAVGRAFAGELIGKFGLVNDADWISFLSRIRDRLLPFSGRPNIPYHVVILEIPVPNAASTPGWIFVTTGLIRSGLDADGWAFVMGHEMAHTARRHLAALIEREYATRLAAVIIAVVTGNATVDAANLIHALLRLTMLGFDRELEVQADTESLRMMVEAGYEPSKAASTLMWFNEVTGSQQEQTHWTGTHPGFADRVKQVNAAYAAFSSRGLPLRVWHFRESTEADGVAVSVTRVAEMADGWVISVSVNNAGDGPVTILGGSVTLLSPDGSLPVRFLRSSLPGEVEAKAHISGDLVFEKRSSQPPTALSMPLLSPVTRRDVQIMLTRGGLFVPAPPASPLPRPPAEP